MTSPSTAATPTHTLIQITDVHLRPDGMPLVGDVDPADCLAGTLAAVGAPACGPRLTRP